MAGYYGTKRSYRDRDVDVPVQRKRYESYFDIPSKAQEQDNRDLRPRSRHDETETTLRQDYGYDVGERGRVMVPIEEEDVIVHHSAEVMDWGHRPVVDMMEDIYDEWQEIDHSQSKPHKRPLSSDCDDTSRGESVVSGSRSQIHALESEREYLDRNRVGYPEKIRPLSPPPPPIWPLSSRGKDDHSSQTEKESYRSSHIRRDDNRSKQRRSRWHNEEDNRPTKTREEDYRNKRFLEEARSQKPYDSHNKGDMQSGPAAKESRVKEDWSRKRVEDKGTKRDSNLGREEKSQASPYNRDDRRDRQDNNEAKKRDKGGSWRRFDDIRNSNLRQEERWEIQQDNEHHENRTFEKEMYETETQSTNKTSQYRPPQFTSGFESSQQPLTQTQPSIKTTEYHPSQVISCFGSTQQLAAQNQSTNKTTEYQQSQVAPGFESMLQFLTQNISTNKTTEYQPTQIMSGLGSMQQPVVQIMPGFGSMQQPVTQIQSTNETTEYQPLHVMSGFGSTQHSLTQTQCTDETRTDFQLPQNVMPTIESKQQPQEQTSLNENSSDQPITSKETVDDKSTVEPSRLSQVIEELEKVTLLIKYRLEHNKESEKYSQDEIYPLQYLPHLKPKVQSETAVENMLKTKNLLGWEKHYEENEMSEEIFFGRTIPSNVLKKETVRLNSGLVEVSIVPEDGESLYSSLAHLLFGPFRSTTELTKTAIALHRSLVQSIRPRKKTFIMRFKELYKILYPKHNIKREYLFDHCCLYLSKPGHLGTEHMVYAFSLVFNITVIILYEDGRSSTRTEPNLGYSSNKPIAILSRSNPFNHFDPVESCQELADFKNTSSKQLAEVDPYSEFDDPKLHENAFKSFDPVMSFSDFSSFETNSTKQPAKVGLYSTYEEMNLVVATWHVPDFADPEHVDIVDHALAKHNIHLACVQTKHLPFMHGELSSICYNWWCSDKNHIQPTECVAFLLHKSSPGTLSNVCFHSKYLTSAFFSFNKIDFIIIGCYLPNCTDTQKYYEVSEDLQVILKKFSPLYKIIILGQFNACLGLSDTQQVDQGLIGQRLLQQASNENGLFIKRLAVKYNLCVLNTICGPNDPTPATYLEKNHAGSKRGNKELKLQLSYILLSKGPDLRRGQKKKDSKTQNIQWWEPISKHAVVACRIYLDKYFPLS